MNPTAHKSKNNSAVPSHHQNINGAGFKGQSKRSAFGDLSNTAGHLVKHNIPTNGFAKHAVPKPTATAKMVSYKDENKENSVKNGKSNDSFLRPAQRPSVSLKPSSTANGFPVHNDYRGQPVLKPTVAKRATLVYNDDHQQKPQSLSRQYRSQPHLKSVEAPVLRRTQSKHQILEEIRDAAHEELYEEPYEDALEELPREESSYVPSQMAPVGLPGSTGPPITVDMKPLQPVPTASSMHPMPSAPSIPEPEEYWDEEDDEDLYDEQGYTTAHSYKSYADITTGATALLVPKVTSKIQKELEEARHFVESTRPQEDIDEEEWDVSMVAEYGEEIFQYMGELEVSNLAPSSSMMCCERGTDLRK